MMLPTGRMPRMPRRGRRPYPPRRRPSGWVVNLASVGSPGSGGDGCSATIESGTSNWEGGQGGGGVGAPWVSAVRRPHHRARCERARSRQIPQSASAQLARTASFVAQNTPSWCRIEAVAVLRRQVIDGSFHPPHQQIGDHRRTTTGAPQSGRIG
jgi:hypothetical protein